MPNLEIERTYLIKFLPDLTNAKAKKIVDIYVPPTSKPTLRIRQNGDKFELTKKVQVDPTDLSTHNEFTIPLTQVEFEFLRNNLPNKIVEKTRYTFEVGKNICELDIFEGSLKGFAVADFEFRNREEFDNFEIPDFCLVDVTQENFIAGKYLAGKSYEDIEIYLDKFGFRKLTI